MELGNLNIYRISGVPAEGKVGAASERGRYKFWNAGTVDYTNTRAFNYLLADVNAKLAIIDNNLSDNIASLYNNVDVDILCLEALSMNKADAEAYPLDFLGMVIAEMNQEGMFGNDSTDEVVRSNNLDNLMGIFESRVSETLTGYYSRSFYSWWTDEIMANNFNSNTAAQVQRYEEYFSNIGSGKIGDAETVAIPDPSEYTSMTDYIRACGPCFLYMFIPEDEKDQYNVVINYKRRIELNDTYSYIKNNVGAMMTEAGIKALFALGMVDYWGMTPQQKLKQVKEYGGGKVGDMGVAEIITIILTIIQILLSLLALIKEIYTLTYSITDKAKKGVPDGSDLDELYAAGSKASNTDNNKLFKGDIGMVAGIALLFAFLYNSDN